MNYIDRLFSLKDKIVVISGGAGFLCGEIALAFHRAGASVSILDSDLSNAKKISNKIINDNGKSIALEMNVNKKADFKFCLKRILDEFSKVDILINGAGINAPTPFLNIKEDDWDKIMSVHLKGTLFGCQVFGEQMLSQSSGSIINISSASAGPPLSKAFAYSVAKAGIKNLTQNLAREWATKGVRVNALRPGFFPTEWSKKNFITPDREKSILDHTPMSRFGKPEELCGAVLWMASDAASFVTGAEIPVDGGFSAMTI